MGSQAEVVPSTSESSAAPFPQESQLFCQRGGKRCQALHLLERTIEFVNEFKGMFSYTSIQHIPPGTCRALW